MKKISELNEFELKRLIVEALMEGMFNYDQMMEQGKKPVKDPVVEDFSLYEEVYKSVSGKDLVNKNLRIKKALQNDVDKVRSFALWASEEYGARFEDDGYSILFTYLEDK